ncbi:hypothetical protein [Desulfonema magnum]|uniref:Lipoprotein n=1 Tax=Desulfonema magnum TaxID=45655 RepID=A0A975BTI4_9BACT|nr:hypothetical protein [Desulfonema magnum]QTA91232.1 Uncharacterized protein dnm_072960 [Desulfonema magnum]
MNKKNQAIMVCLICLILMCIGACSKKDAEMSQQKNPKTFTFFDIDANTRLTERIKWKLKNKLGSDVLERGTLADMTTNYKGFLQNYFPKLYELSRELRYDDVMDTEDNPVKLTYRHTQNKNTPFAYVEIVFSGHTKKPLFFRIKTKKQRSDVIDVLRKKYGDPAVTDWNENVAYGKKGRSLHWNKDNDILIVSIVPDRFGDPEYYIMIYYVNNLEENAGINKERRERKQKENKTIDNAF